MKTIYLFCFIVFFCQYSRANIHIVTVSNNQFTPANLPNVVVGDIVSFSFLGGGLHNVNSSSVINGVPPGTFSIYSGVPASSSRTYDYLVTKPGLYAYICDIHGDAATFTGMVGRFTATSALLIPILNFIIGTDITNKPYLSWKTEGNINLNHFVVKASEDGIHYAEIGQKNANENNQNNNYYSFIDERNITPFRYLYYLVVAIDNSLQESYSEVKMYKNAIAKAGIINSISPNPVNSTSQIMIQFNAEKKSQLNAAVYNSLGERVAQSKMSAFEGINNGHITLNRLPAGNYKIKFTLAGAVEVRTIMVK